jgi:hypothetical protein
MNTKLRQRFVKDYNLPINVFDEELFKYYMDLYHFFPKEKWETLKKDIQDKYRGNVEVWLNYCAEVRDKAINGVMETQKYKDFNSSDLSKYKLSKNIGEHSYYTEATNGCKFISIDLKKANFQTMKYVGVIDDETYSDFIDRFGGDEYIKNSKYLRQVIFGKMNPGRTITVEKYIMSKIMDIVESLIVNGIELYSQNSDEIVYKVIDDISIVGMMIFCNTVENVVKQKMNIDVRAEYVEIKKLPIVNCNGNNVDAFVRKNLLTGEEVLKKASTTFYPQIYKLWKGMEIEDRDLVFYFEDQLCKFNMPLTFK